MKKPPSVSQVRIVLKRVLADVAVNDNTNGDGANAGQKGSNKSVVSREVISGNHLPQDLVPKGRDHGKGANFGPQLRRSTFGQIYSQLHQQPSGLYFRTGHIWKVEMAGFNSEDAGGPFRESIALMFDDLQSAKLPLFLPTPNNRQNIGTRRGDFLPNPSLQATSVAAMFKFVGKLMGMAIRSGEFLPLSLPPLLWARLVDSPVTANMLKQSHLTHVSAMELFAGVHFSKEDPEIVINAQGETLCEADDFEDLFCKDFTIIGIDGRTHNLVPGGDNNVVEAVDAPRYADLAIAFSIHECDWAIDRIREGMQYVVPVNLLSYLRWDQLELMVCGEATVDLKLLRMMTKYENYDLNSKTVKLFWEVMEDLPNKDRTQVI